MMLIKNALIHGERKNLLIDQGKIVRIFPSEECMTLLTDPSELDLHGLKLYPGLIDIHSHGNTGHDTMDGKYLEEMSRYELRHGITSWCPTTMTMPLDTVEKVCSIDTDSMEARTDCAHILGFHMEGPYISPKYKGAQKEEYICSPKWEDFSKIKNIALVTLAPELPGSIEFIEKTASSKDSPVICLGHTDTDYETALAAFEAGAGCVTHLMNAMTPLHHRNPGLFGAAVTSDAYVQVICDGVHIHPAVIRILYRLFGARRIVLISDSMEATGMPDGDYTLGGQAVQVRHGEARTIEGNLAGSTTNLFDMVRHAIDFGIPEEEAFAMATSTPAQLLGISDQKGIIREGADADLIAVNERNELIYIIRSGILQERTLS